MKVFQFMAFRIKLPKPLRIKFNKMDGFMILLDG